jgi:hypothetical protein
MLECACRRIERLGRRHHARSGLVSTDNEKVVRRRGRLRRDRLQLDIIRLGCNPPLAGQRRVGTHHELPPSDQCNLVVFLTIGGAGEITWIRVGRHDQLVGDFIVALYLPVLGVEPEVAWIAQVVERKRGPTDIVRVLYALNPGIGEHFARPRAEVAPFRAERNVFGLRRAILLEVVARVRIGGFQISPLPISIGPVELFDASSLQI